jgi:hypothetical protein
MPESSIAAAYGTPFQKMRVTASEEYAKMGVPLGLWQVYHLTPADDRMYVTILHFDHSGADGQPLPSAVVDSIMLYPGHWTVAQILSDQPGIASICAAGCDVVRGTDKSGDVSLLLEPQQASSNGFMLYFMGDSGTIKWRNVSSPQSEASWVYIVRRADFDKSRQDLTKQIVGTWRPATRSSH